MDTDIEILEYLARLFKHHVKQSLVDPEEIFEEFKRYSQDELDYMKEAHIIKLFHDNFKDDKKVKIPLVYEQLTTKRVLTMEFVEGVEIRKIISHPGNYQRVDKKNLSQLIVNSVMKQIFIDGLFHADPHPGNIIFNKGKIGFIDFGIVGKIDEGMKEKIGFLFISLLTKDTDSIVKAFISLNLVDDDVDADALKKDIVETLGEYYDASIEKVDMVQLFLNSLAVAKKHKIMFSRDFVLLGKALLTLQGLSIELNPEFNLVRATHPFLVKLVKQKTKPSEFIKSLTSEAKMLADFVHGLPGESKKVYRTIEKADLALDSINTDIRGLTKEIRIESWRLIMALLVAAFVIGASLTYKTDSFMSKAFIVLAAIILIYLLFTVFRDNMKRNTLP
jgi:ubiquinone biosynthesis protein